jgi:hypothetical protein
LPEAKFLNIILCSLGKNVQRAHQQLGLMFVLSSRNPHDHDRLRSFAPTLPSMAQNSGAFPVERDSTSTDINTGFRIS